MAKPARGLPEGFSLDLPDEGPVRIGDFLEEAPRGDSARATSAPAGPPRFRIPAKAVRELEGRSVIWLVRDGRLESRPVQAGPVSGGFREIRSGLSGGEMLVVGGVEVPEAGMKVKVQE